MESNKKQSKGKKPLSSLARRFGHVVNADGVAEHVSSFEQPSSSSKKSTARIDIIDVSASADVKILCVR